MKKLICLLLACVGLQADSITLFNDTQYTLKALIYDANGTLMGEFILNPRDATEWSDSSLEFGTNNPTQVLAPYRVDWLCLSGGGAYGSCGYVAAGAVVTAQSCGGVQQCTPEKTTPGAPPMTTKP